MRFCRRVSVAQCGYSGCRPYAEAVGLRREKSIVAEVPGGEAVMLKMAELLNVESRNHAMVKNSRPPVAAARCHLCTTALLHKMHSGPPG